MMNVKPKGKTPMLFCEFIIFFGKIVSKIFVIYEGQFFKEVLKNWKKIISRRWFVYIRRWMFKNKLNKCKYDPEWTLWDMFWNDISRIRNVIKNEPFGESSWKVCK